MQGLRKLDIFPKFDSRFETEAREKTAFGAFLSIASLCIAAVLAIGELQYFLSVENRHELYVDNTALSNRLTISINVSFLTVPCDLIGIDAIDSFGEFQQDLEKTTVKSRISKDGNYIGVAESFVNTGKKETTTNDERNPDGTRKCLSCYGAELYPGECCNTCEDVRRAYARRSWTIDEKDLSIVQCAKEVLARASASAAHEGCNIAASMNVRRVQGNIHFIPGRAFKHLGQHLHDVTAPEMKTLNLSHTFHALEFGERYPGLVNPLDGQSRISTLPVHGKTEEGDKPTVTGVGANRAMAQLTGVDDSIGTPFGGGKYQYFVKVVPTRFERLSGEMLNTNQYSVTEHFAPIKLDPNFVPGLFIIYDLSPLVIHIYEARPYASVAHFVLELCAIVGGVFTVAGLLDAVLHHGAKQVKRKMQIGKLS